MLPDTAPLTPPACDLRSMPFMPLDVTRLMDSDFFALSSPAEFKAAVALWAKSWLQVPAASLPNDDRVLAFLAGGLTLVRWRKVKDVALRGWIACSDGRIYHPLIAELALDAWDRVQHLQRDEQPTRRAGSSAERMRRLRARRKSMEQGGPAEPDPAAQPAVAGSDTGGDASRVTPDVTRGDDPLVTEEASPVTHSRQAPPQRKEEGEGDGGAQAVTPAKASQRHLPVLAAMPVSAGGDPLSRPAGSPAKGQGRAGRLSLTPDEQQLCDAVWAQYGAAYQSRYDAPPLSDSRARHQVAELVRRLGVQAPDVAAYYVRSNHDWYVRKGHDVGTLLGDLQKLRAEWMAMQKRARQCAVATRPPELNSGAPPPRPSEAVQIALESLAQKLRAKPPRAAGG
ncbi:DUF1376 domain-containing protein [Thiomonas intermedia]|uniref:DUF1376 domain-containing protein n=1 Tax=Thiomonas intermedia TaxID=926 RepID=UPI0009A534F3|nr:DUF1376 domain-containing protein [Thiomonas intermedia]